MVSDAGVAPVVRRRRRQVILAGRGRGTRPSLGSGVLQPGVKKAYLRAQPLPTTVGQLILREALPPDLAPDTDRTPDRLCLANHP